MGALIKVKPMELDLSLEVVKWTEQSEGLGITQICMHTQTPPSPAGTSARTLPLGASGFSSVKWECNSPQGGIGICLAHSKNSIHSCFSF